MAEDNYGNIGKESFEEINRSAQLFKETVRETGKELGEDFKNTVSIAKTLSGVSAELLKDRKQIQKVENAITSAATELTELKAQELNLQGQLLGASKEEGEEILKQLESVQVRKDAMSSMVDDAKILVSEAQKLSSQTKFFDRLQSAAESIPGLGPLISGPFQAAATAAKEAAESGGGLLGTYVAGGKELLKVLGPAAVLGMLLKASAETKKLSTNLGISLDSATEMQKRFGQFATDSRDSRITSTKLAEAQNSLQKSLKLGVEFSGDTLENFTKLTEYMGVSAAAASRLALLTEGSALSSDEFQSSLAQSVVESNKALGLNISLSEAFETIGSASASTYLTLRRSPQQLGKMVAEAKKLGLEFSQIEGIASSMLDFESSIQAELEAEVLTGKQLNFERARMAALQGDTLTLTKEIASQVGTIAEFENMNVIARESLAKSMGLTSDQMAEMLLKSEALKANEEIASKMSAEQLQTARDKVSSTKSLGEALIEVNQEAGIDKKFQDSADKLKDAFKQISIQVTPIVTKLADFIAKAFSSPLVKTAAIMGSLGSAGILLASLAASVGRGTMLRPMVTRDVSSGLGKGARSHGVKMRASRMGKFGMSRGMGGAMGLKGVAGGLGLGALGMGVSYLGNKAEEAGNEDLGYGLGVGGSALQGAGLGAAIGSVVPVVGTAIGGVIGGGVGAILGFMKEEKEDRERAMKEKEEAEQKRQDEYQKTMQELAQKEAKIFLDSNQVGMGLTLGTNYKTQ